jgi:hypothetical protein
MSRPALLPIRKEGVLQIFIALKKSIALSGFEPATYGSIIANLPIVRVLG